MQGNDVEGPRIPLQELRDGSRDEGVAYAVESILAQAVLARDVLVDGVRGDVRRDGGVELGVEAGDVDSAGQLLETGIDNIQGCAVMQRGQVAQGLEVVICVLGDDLGGLVVPAVDDAVAGNGDVIGGGNLA